MNDLATMQRRLLALVKERWTPGAADDPYLQAAAASPGLLLIREVAAWWQGFAIERTCVLTARLLKQHDTFDATVAAFYRDTAISDYGDAVGVQFLAYVAQNGRGLAAALAAFEGAYLALRNGADIDVAFAWDVDPTAVLMALCADRVPPPILPRGSYALRVASSLPRGFSVQAA